MDLGPIPQSLTLKPKPGHYFYLNFIMSANPPGALLSGSGFRVEWVGFRVQALRLRVYGPGVTVWLRG